MFQADQWELPLRRIPKQLQLNRLPWPRSPAEQVELTRQRIRRRAEHRSGRRRARYRRRSRHIDSRDSGRNQWRPRRSGSSLAAVYDAEPPAAVRQLPFGRLRLPGTRLELERLRDGRLALRLGKRRRDDSSIVHG
jgi:hypothetical protein